MGFDLVTWAPVIGGSGDNVYNVPGATKLDNTLDTTGGPCGVDAGDSSGFLTIPTIAQLNASSGINQVIGLYNRRAGQYNSAFGTSLTIMAYLAAGVKPKATDFTNLFTNISTLRTQEGWTASAIAWPNTTPTAGRAIRGDHVAYLRKALAIAGTIKLSDPNGGLFYNNLRDDNPYGTPVSELNAGSGGFFVNQTPSPSLPTVERRRGVFVYQVPAWLTANISTANMSININTASAQSPAWTLDVYSSPNLDYPVTYGAGGTFYTAPVNLEANVSVGSTGVKTFAITPADIYARANSYLTMTLVGSREFASTACTASEDRARGTGAHDLTITF